MSTGSDAEGGLPPDWVLEFELVALLRGHFVVLPDAAVTLLRRAFASGAIAMRSEAPIPDSGY